MMKLVSYLLFFGVCSDGLILASSQTPIPARPLGYAYVSPEGGQSPKIVLEMFYDHLCPDSKSNWLIMKDVLSDMMGKEVTAIIHIFPLPYHHNAYFVQQVGVVVRKEAPEKFPHFVQLMFDNQDTFLTGAVNMTEPEVKMALAKLTSSELSIDDKVIMAGFEDEVIVENARYAWKYAASRGITGTPEFIVNGVNAPDVPDSKEGWVTFINKLLNAPY